MKIKLWKYFLKQRNSTRQPSVDPYLTLEGYLNDSCSILSPVINFDYDGEDIQTCNFAYIEEYKRYYFIDDWTTNYNLWSASMTVDVMGTYKSDLLGSKQFVARSESRTTGSVIDNIYTTSAQTSVINVEPTNNTVIFGGTSYLTGTLAEKSFEEGYVAVGVTGADAPLGITYYIMPCTAGGLGSLVKNLYNVTPSSFGDIGTGLAKQLANPIQYINSVYWYPALPYNVDISYQSISLGFYEVKDIRCAVVDPCKVAQYVNVALFTIPEHSQVTDYGGYLNYEPYSQYYLNYAPFGTIKLDPQVFMPSCKLRLQFRNDITNGKCDFVIKSTSGSDSGDYTRLVYRGVCNTGVELPLMQRTTDVMGIGSSLVTMSNAIIGNYAGALSGLGNAINSINPDLSQKGAVGGAINWDSSPTIQIIRHNQIGLAPSLFGKAYCQYVKLDTLSGYTKCENAVIQDFLKDGQGALITEYEEVINYLNNGFYIE